MRVHPGVTPGQYQYVEVLDVTAVRVEPTGRESAWNVDGELLENNHVTAQVHKASKESCDVHIHISDQISCWPVGVTTRVYCV